MVLRLRSARRGGDDGERGHAKYALYIRGRDLRPPSAVHDERTALLDPGHGDRSSRVAERKHIESQHHENSIRELEAGPSDLVERPRHMEHDDVTRLPNSCDRRAVVMPSNGDRRDLVAGSQQHTESLLMPPHHFADVTSRDLIPQWQ